MLIKNDFEVIEPVDKVWQFFDNIPQVAACLPGAELTEDLGDDTYRGKVAVRMGPIKLQFAGTAEIRERVPTPPSASSSMPPVPTRRAEAKRPMALTA